MPTPTIADINSELQSIRQQTPGISINDVFVVWFLTAYLTDSKDEAVRALVGGSGDKDCDAILLDHRNRLVHIVQGKWRTNTSKTERRPDVMSFLSLASVTFSSDKWRTYEMGLDSVVRGRLSDAIHQVKKKKYDLRLYYVTSGKISEGLRDEAENQVVVSAGEYDDRIQLQLIEGKSLLAAFKDYLDGVAPALGVMRLAIAPGPSGTSDVLHRRDPQTGIESWIVSMRGSDIGALYQKGGTRLFARNIRGFLGDSDINDAMRETIENDPQNFWYFNNGVTIVCDAVRRVQDSGRDFLLVDQPQIINGQQTTRTLARVASRAATVLVKVIRIDRAAGDFKRYDNLVSAIVRATNWQNPIKPADLVSNDYTQIVLDRELRKLGYQYLRKRQSKREARAALGNASLIQVKKEELGQAVAACDFEPSWGLSGVQALFEAAKYTQIFSSLDAERYLSRFCAMHRTLSAARGRKVRAYAKWHALYLAWNYVEPALRARTDMRLFREAWELRDDEFLLPFDRLVDLMFTCALRYYNKNRGTGEEAQDRQSFFKQALHTEALLREAKGPQYGPKARRLVTRLEAALQSRH